MLAGLAALSFMIANEFRSELRRRLENDGDRVLLRIVISGSSAVELTGNQILREALQLAQKFTQSRAGSVVLLLLPHSPELFLLHLGLVLTERIPAILPWPTNRIDPEKYQRNLVHQLGNLPADEIITLSTLAQNLSSALPYPVSACPMDSTHRWVQAFSVPLSLERVTHSDVRQTASLRPAEALFLQFSGGTTGAQKAVVITAPMLTAQLESLRACLGFTPEDSVVSWLPMYHDMGLIACLWLPLWNGAQSLHFAASDWLLNPALLFELVTRHRGTLCWLPNFAFSFMAGQHERIQGTYGLHHVRAWINCSEPVRLFSFNAFAEQYAHWGVSPESLQASYAMAENVFAVTQTELGKPPATFPRASVNRSGAYPQLAFDLIDDVYVSSGRMLDGMQGRIVNSKGETCEEGGAGEIQIHTESLFSGYWGRQGFVTSAFTGDGWYATGDYGFFANGELFVVGRLREMIIVGGQNIFPEDVETVVNSVPGIYPGRVVAFGVMNEAHGTEGLAIVAETRGDFNSADVGSLQNEIFRLILNTIGVAPRVVAVVPQRWIVKSTAGKISRRDTRDRFQREMSG
jgi:fatty-acyl-CoA synthase